MKKHSSFVSAFNLGEKVKFTIDYDGEYVPDEIPATIHAVHFYTGKVKYDLDISVSSGGQTRIYNIDSIWIK